MNTLIKEALKRAVDEQVCQFGPTVVLYEHDIAFMVQEIEQELNVEAEGIDELYCAAQDYLQELRCEYAYEQDVYDDQQAFGCSEAGGLL